MTTKMLAQPGYTVLSALTPAAALDLVANHPGDIHLLMTDVVMPDMNGRELSQRVLARRPGIKCLFVSGYTADTIAQHGVLEAGVSFLHKPYSGKTLLAKVADMLGREARPRE
jgi:DNA-binding response OmpR family regulator